MSYVIQLTLSLHIAFELAEKVNVLLINWLLDHIKVVDKELGKF